VNAHRYCQRKSRAAWLRRVREIAGVLVPGAMLALMPKCPMCLAAYVALGTGFTLSYTSAHLVMRALTVLCIGTLSFCLASRVVRQLRQKQTFHLQPTNTLQ